MDGWVGLDTDLGNFPIETIRRELPKQASSPSEPSRPEKKPWHFRKIRVFWF